jgi:hypothetical protein
MEELNYGHIELARSQQSHPLSTDVDPDAALHEFRCGASLGNFGSRYTEVHITTAGQQAEHRGIPAITRGSCRVGHLATESHNSDAPAINDTALRKC